MFQVSSAWFIHLTCDSRMILKVSILWHMCCEIFKLIVETRIVEVANVQAYIQQVSTFYSRNGGRVQSFSHFLFLWRGK